MFVPVRVIQSEVFAQIPAAMWRSGRHGNVLEGPCFDAHGNLYVVNVAGQIFRITAQRQVELVLEYDGEPNGLKIDADGALLIADHRLGLLRLCSGADRVEVVIDRARQEPFRGLNDLSFGPTGELFFTDQGESDLHEPNGRLWKRDGEGRLRLVLDHIPSPNGLVLTPDGKFVYLAVTRANAIWRVPLRRDGTLGRVGVYIHLSGGIGPDGLALDAAAGLAVAHAGMGAAWLFDDVGRPVAEVRSCRGRLITNVAYGGADGRTLFMTEGESHSVLCARVPVGGSE